MAASMARMVRVILGFINLQRPFQRSSGGEGADLGFPPRWGNYAPERLKTTGGSRDTTITSHNPTLASQVPDRTIQGLTD